MCFLLLATSVSLGQESAPLTCVQDIPIRSVSDIRPEGFSFVAGRSSSSSTIPLSSELTEYSTTAAHHHHHHHHQQLPITALGTLSPTSLSSTGDPSAKQSKSVPESSGMLVLSSQVRLLPFNLNDTWQKIGLRVEGTGLDSNWPWEQVTTKGGSSSLVCGTFETLRDNSGLEGYHSSTWPCLRWVGLACGLCRGGNIDYGGFGHVMRRT